MWFSSWPGNQKRSDAGKRVRTPVSSSRQRASFRPQLEALEDRMLPSTYYAATASDLIADINAANTAGGANTIVLTAPTTNPYVLTAVNNTTDGPTVLPVIAFKKHDHVTPNNLTILTGNGTANPGYGDIIDASRVGRLFDVASPCSLTLENVTLQNGRAYIDYKVPAAKGGAIYNLGTLILSGVLIQNNAAVAYVGDAAGGGVWSNGSLTLENSTTLLGNSALGGAGSGNAFGGGIYIAGGTANITGTTFGDGYFIDANKALGGNGGGSAYGGAVCVAGGTVTLNGDNLGGPLGAANLQQWNIAQGDTAGYGYGGGLCVLGGTVTLTNDVVENNVADSYYGYNGYGGGIYVRSGATVSYDPFTYQHTLNNTPNDIYYGP